MTFGRIKKSYVRCSIFASAGGAKAPQKSAAQRAGKPPVGAVGGHVAQRNGAVFTADPGPSVKKRGASGKRAGDAQRDGSNTASTSSNLGRLCR